MLDGSANANATCKQALSKHDRGNHIWVQCNMKIPLSISKTQEPYCWFDVDIPKAFTGYGLESSLITITTSKVYSIISYSLLIVPLNGVFPLRDTKADTETDKDGFYSHCRETGTKGSFTPSESENESEKDQRTIGRDHRKNVKHQRKLSLMLIPIGFCTHFIAIYVGLCLDVGRCEYTLLINSLRNQK